MTPLLTIERGYSERLHRSPRAGRKPLRRWVPRKSLADEAQIVIPQFIAGKSGNERSPDLVSKAGPKLMEFQQS